DAVLLAQANVVFVNGLNLEPRSVQLAEANVRPGVEIIELGRRTISPDEYIFDFSFPQDTGDPNPHLWTNPRYVKRYAEIIAEELAAIDPAGAAEYRVNARVFGDRIDALDAALRRATATIPPERRLLLTYHDSFPYFARDYGWTVIGAIQPSDFSEPSPREVADLIRQIQGTGVSAIFGSEVFPSPVLEQIAREAGVEYIPDLRDDDLPGDPGDGDHSLLALLLFDFRTIVGALGGDPAHFDGVPTENVCDAAEYRS
ncbi:MAG: metal ABC transporter substrate-binding protein, partial [Acidimicrobiia bacterium]